MGAPTRFEFVSDSVATLYRQRMAEIERSPYTDDPDVYLMLQQSARAQLRAEVREWVRLGGTGRNPIPV